MISYCYASQSNTRCLGAFVLFARFGKAGGFIGVDA